jgi:multidrug efflux pump subunit AcrA (membrane-fusion protein)
LPPEEFVLGSGVSVTRPGRSRRAAALAAWVALLVALPGCAPPTTRSTASAPASREVTRGLFRSGLLLTGELQAVESSKIIVPRTPSWQMPIRWMEADGAAVAEGQKVIELDNTEFSGDLEQNRLAESKALNDLMQKEADIAVDIADKEFRLEQARVQREKARIEAEVPMAIRTRREHQEKQLALAKAEVDLEKAREELEASRKAAAAELEELGLALQQARYEVRVAEEAIEALTLRAPRDGILVVAENRREGRKFQTGDNAFVGLPLASIPELTSMQVEALLSDVDDGKIAPGMRALCVLDTYPEESFDGEVVEITPVAKEQGRESRRRAFRTVIRLHGSDPARMRPGMSVRIEVLPPPREDVLLVPRETLDFSGEQPRALLSDGSSVEVRLGPCNPFHCVAEDGLAEGQLLRGSR